MFYYRETTKCVDPIIVSDSHYHLAQMHYMDADIDSAIKQYEKAIITNPSHFWALNSVGSIYTIKGEYDKAIKILTNAAKIDPVHSCYNLKRAYEG